MAQTFSPLGGMAQAAGNAARTTMSNAFGLREAAADGRTAAWDALKGGGATAAPSPNSSGAQSAAGDAPLWAQQIRAEQTARHHRQIAAQAISARDPSTAGRAEPLGLAHRGALGHGRLQAHRQPSVVSAGQAMLASRSRSKMQIAVRCSHLSSGICSRQYPASAGFDLEERPRQRFCLPALSRGCHEQAIERCTTEGAACYP